MSKKKKKKKDALEHQASDVYAASRVHLKSLFILLI